MISQGIKPEKTWTEWAKEKSGIDSKRDSDSIAKKIGGEVLEKYKQHSELMDEIKEKKSKTFAKNLEDSDKSPLGR